MNILPIFTIFYLLSYSIQQTQKQQNLCHVPKKPLKHGPFCVAGPPGERHPFALARAATAPGGLRGLACPALLGVVVLFDVKPPKSALLTKVQRVRTVRRSWGLFSNHVDKWWRTQLLHWYGRLQFVCCRDHLVGFPRCLLWFYPLCLYECDVGIHFRLVQGEMFRIAERSPL